MTISDLAIDESRNWRRKHLRAISQSYGKAGQFADRFARLEPILGLNESRLSALCVHQLNFWLREMRISTQVVLASELDVVGAKSDLLLSICRKLNADTYISGPLGRGYLDEDAFTASGIRIIYHDYKHPTYQQLHGNFLPCMSVVDWWLNSNDAIEFSRGSNKS